MVLPVSHWTRSAVCTYVDSRAGINQINACCYDADTSSVGIFLYIIE